MLFPVKTEVKRLCKTLLMIVYQFMFLHTNFLFRFYFAHTTILPYTEV